MKILTFKYYDILKYSVKSVGNCFFMISMRVTFYAELRLLNEKR